MRPLVIFDVDGTIADCTHRLHHIRYNASVHYKEENFKKNWDKFYEACVFDEPIEKTILLLNVLQLHCDIKFFTGRRESTREATIKWMDHHLQLVAIDLYMRAQDDYRPDYEIKRDMYNTFSPEDKFRLLGVFEDRASVVTMWRNEGVKCYQVDTGDF